MRKTQGSEFLCQAAMFGEVDQIRIVEGNEKHLAYTSTEKLELLMKINPTLGRLRDEFNLTLD